MMTPSHQSFDRASVMRMIVAGMERGDGVGRKLLPGLGPGATDRTQADPAQESKKRDRQA
jgi:hypothetical protein